ncbi:unnamed protein product, partial [Rotaria socialis]
SALTNGIGRIVDDVVFVVELNKLIKFDDEPDEGDIIDISELIDDIRYQSLALIFNGASRLSFST